MSECPPSLTGYDTFPGHVGRGGVNIIKETKELCGLNYAGINVIGQRTFTRTQLTCGPPTYEPPFLTPIHPSVGLTCEQLYLQSVVVLGF